MLRNAMANLLSERLLSATSPAKTEELKRIADLETRLSAIIEQGRAAHPGISVSDDAWLRHLGSRLSEAEEPIADVLPTVRSEDVYLAFACLEGVPRALAELDRRLVRAAPQALSGLRLGANTSVDELLQLVREKLLVGSPQPVSESTPASGAVATSGPGKLAQYSGRGPLDGWLRVTLARTALSELRRKDPLAARDDDASALANVASAADPALDQLRQRSEPALRSAIEAAIAELSAEERALMRLHFVDGLTIDDLASVYAVHRATTARRLARIRGAIFERARAQAMSALGIGETEFESLMGVMLSRLDLTIKRLLND